MKTKCILGAVLGIFILFFAGCATTSYNSSAPKPIKSIWPSLDTNYQWYYYTPEKIPSAEEAIGTIKNLEKNFVEWNAGVLFSSLDADRYGLRAKWEWTETTQYQTYTPSYGGFFAGWNYVPTYNGTYQTHQQTQEHKDSLTIPFSEVSGLKLGYLPILNRDYKWGLTVFLKDNGKPIFLRILNQKSAWQLANSIATLSNFNFSSTPKLGFMSGRLTAEQSGALNLQPGVGVLITSVAVDSPVDKAGIKFLDVIMGVEDSPEEEFQKIVKEIEEKVAQPGRKSLSLKILRSGNSSVIDIPF